MSHLLERRKAYATHLLKTALRYGSEEDLAALTKVIEVQIASMLATHYNPGLNDASYDVFRKFWLQGGVK
jgi:predicted acetyltransferase